MTYISNGPKIKEYTFKLKYPFKKRKNSNLCSMLTVEKNKNEIFLLNKPKKNFFFYPLPSNFSV